MNTKIVWTFALVGIAGAVLLLVARGRWVNTAGDLPQGHELQCMKADGRTPCGDPEIADLNNAIAGLKKAVAAAKTATGDAQGVVGDAKQAGENGKQLGSDAKQLGSDAKKKELKKAVGDAKQAGGDAETATGDAKQATGDAKQLAGDAQQVAKALKGIGGLTLKSPDGTMTCVQDDGTVCSDEQTSALQVHAAQLEPTVTVRRKADPTGN